MEDRLDLVLRHGWVRGRRDGLKSVATNGTLFDRHRAGRRMARVLAWAALVALVGVAPLAAAQVPAAKLELRVERPTSEVKPLEGNLTIPFTLTASCAAAPPAGKPVTLELSLASVPAWATMVVSPARFVLPPERCPEGSVAFTGNVVAKATDLAPAHVNATVKLVVTAQDAAVNATAEDAFPIAASYFGLLDVQLAQTIMTTTPGSTVVFPIKVANFGNSPTLVQFTIQEASPGLQADALPDLTLDSKQAGGSAISKDAFLTIHTNASLGYNNAVGYVTVKITSREAPAGAEGDETTASVVVTTKGFSAPGASLALTFVATLVALIRRR
jgi:hypothetical protein